MSNEHGYYQRPDPVVRANAKTLQARKLIEALAARSGSGEITRQLRQVAELMLNHSLPNLAVLLPLLLNLKGQPYTLENHYPFEPFFSTLMSQSIVLKAGRQVSKTISTTDDNRVYLHNCRPVSFRQIYKGYRVLSTDEHGNTVLGTVVDKIYAGKKQVIKVTTRLGSVIEQALTHPLMTDTGWVRGADLVVGRRVLAINSGGLFGSLSTTNRSKIVEAAVINAGEKLGSWAPDLARKLHMTTQGIASSLRSDKLLGRTGRNIQLPPRIFRLDKPSTALFLKSVFGSAGKNGLYKTGSSLLANDLRAILIKFDVTVAIVSVGDEFILCPVDTAAQVALKSALDIDASTPGELPADVNIPDVWRVPASALERAGSYVWDEIISIEPLGFKDCWDIEVLAHHNYMVNGLVSHNSTSLAAQGVIVANCLPYFNTLYVTPLFEMVRRFSNNYVRGFIDQSPVKRLWTSTSTSSNVLQRSFVNQSNMFFSFAFLDADRTRGINADRCSFDEVQDLDSSFIPIIRETMSGSEWGIQQYAGTPKTLDNTLEGLWQRSSQAEWVIDCTKCHYENVPAMEYDLDEMIGPWHPDISENNPGTICAKCGLPINPRYGRWFHRHPERIGAFSGYHIPQIIMPMHFANPDKWQILVGKREGWFDTPANVFYNEVCGESYDTGSKLVTVTELKAAAVGLHENDEEIASKCISNYVRRVLSIDWGGGGADEVSFTTYAVLGLTTTGQVHCIYGHRSNTPHDFNREARIALDLIGKFGCSHLVHDYNGTGAHREKYIIDAGFPYERVIPMWYVRAASQGMMRFIPASSAHPRDHYKLDKARSLTLTCHQIKNGGLRFFDYDYRGDDRPGLIHDFLALAEEKVDSRTGRDIYTITRMHGRSDDFAQSVNMGCCALWYMTGQWPNVAEMDNYRADEDVLRAVSPSIGDVVWDDI